MNKLAGILVGVGAVNWLFVGLFNFDLVQFIFRIDWLITGVYVLVGLSGVVFLVKMFKCCGSCNSCKTCSSSEEPKEDVVEDSTEEGEGHQM